MRRTLLPLMLTWCAACATAPSSPTSPDAEAALEPERPATPALEPDAQDAAPLQPTGDAAPASAPTPEPEPEPAPAPPPPELTEAYPEPVAFAETKCPESADECAELIAQRTRLARGRGDWIAHADVMALRADLEERQRPKPKKKKRRKKKRRTKRRSKKAAQLVGHGPCASASECVRWGAEMERRNEYEETSAYYHLACRHADADACALSAKAGLQATFVSVPDASYPRAFGLVEREYARACDLGSIDGCIGQANLYALGINGRLDPARADELHQRAQSLHDEAGASIDVARRALDHTIAVLSWGVRACLDASNVEQTTAMLTYSMMDGPPLYSKLETIDSTGARAAIDESKHDALVSCTRDMMSRARVLLPLSAQYVGDVQVR